MNRFVIGRCCSICGAAYKHRDGARWNTNVHILTWRNSKGSSAGQ